MLSVTVRVRGASPSEDVGRMPGVEHDAHELTRTVFCNEPGCEREATGGRGSCRNKCQVHKDAIIRRVAESNRRPKSLGTRAGDSDDPLVVEAQNVAGALRHFQALRAKTAAASLAEREAYHELKVAAAQFFRAIKQVDPSRLAG